MSNKQDILANLIDQSIKNGATDADAILVKNNVLSCEVRLNKVINVEHSSSESIALRVLINQQQAIVTSSDLSKDSCKLLIDKAINIAKSTPTNPHLFLNKNPKKTQSSDLQIFDNSEPSTIELIEQAKNAESFALENTHITNSEGCQAFSGQNQIYFATSENFFDSYDTSIFGLSLSVIAGNGPEMQSGYEYSQCRFYQDLKSHKEIGNNAAKMAIDKLNPKKIPTGSMPVIFDKRAARTLLSSFASAINGNAISRKTSFLLDKVNQQIFPEHIEIIDDPFLPKGLASRPFDGDAILGQKRSIVSNGVLQTYLLDLQSASKLNLSTTGHAHRSLSSAPSPGPTNFYLKPGTKTLNELIANISKGILVTEILGHGANVITGDFSQGINGFYIENGQIKFPVSGITVAGNLIDMFKKLEVANDLLFESSINSPSLLIDNITVAGE